MREGTPQDKPHRRRTLRTGCLAVLLFALLGSGGGLWWYSEHSWTAAKLERLIAVEIPAGCDRATAEAWFDRHGIQYGWSEDTTGDGRGNQTMPEWAGLESSDLSGMLRGHINGPAANVDWIVPGRIIIYFFFDKQGRCVGHLVEPRVLGL